MSRTTLIFLFVDMIMKSGPKLEQAVTLLPGQKCFVDESFEQEGDKCLESSFIILTSPIEVCGFGARADKNG
jgi:hypothetical protein